MATQKLSSRIDNVKIYAAGATVTRIAELQLIPGKLPEEVEIAQLPLALDDSSVRVRVETRQGNAPIAGDIRIGLAVPPPSETPNRPLEEELRTAKIEVKQIQDVINLIEQEISVLNQLEVPERPESELGVAPPASPMSARLALANFSDEQIRLKIEEKRENLENLAKAKENLADLEQKQAIASTAKNAKPEELRKTVIVSLSYENELSNLNQTIQLVLEYFVPGARWTPTYVCRLNSVENQATIAVRALICQGTGEDWSSVKLELSTANPIAWCAIPELPSLRLGKAQTEIKKAGWRKPPIGAEILFEDFDRQKESALAAVSKHRLITDIELPEFQNLQFAELDELLAEQESIESLEFQNSQFAELHDDDLFCEASTDFADLAEITTESCNYADGREEEFFDLESSLPPPKSAPLPQARSVLLRSVPYEIPSDDEFIADFLPFSLMRMDTADNLTKRGKLSIKQRQESYLEILQSQKVVVNFNIIEVVQQSVYNAQKCLYIPLPPGGINVRKVAASFDYAYSADGRIDIPSDGQFHSVALTTKTTDVDVRYIVVPREDTNVFRIAQLRNPLSAPLLSGPADVYV
ncbi:MAG: mucoidy inhibitor MuiA family protein, partial [Phormidium sp.]